MNLSRNIKRFLYPLTALIFISLIVELLHHREYISNYRKFVPHHLYEGKFIRNNSLPKDEIKTPAYADAMTSTPSILNGLANDKFSYGISFDDAVAKHPCVLKTPVLEKLVKIVKTNKVKYMKFADKEYNSIDVIPRRMNKTEYESVIELMGGWIDFCKKNDITFVVTYGALLGSYMNHDVMPWDEDVDLALKCSDIPKYRHGLRDKSFWEKWHIWNDRSKPMWDYDVVMNLTDDISDPEYFPFTCDKYHTKFCFNTTRKIRQYKWSWPFLDVNVYDENSTHWWVCNKTPWVIEKKFIHPITYRPLGSLTIPTPYKPLEFVKKKYKEFKCKDHYWDHMNERGTKPKRANCSDVLQHYPYVCRISPMNINMEVLIQKGRVLQYYIPPQEAMEKTKPYNFTLE